jgi:VCBS repeat protein
LIAIMATPAVLSSALFACTLATACAKASPFLRATSVPVGLHPIDAAIGDVDADGILDLISANARAKTLSVLLGRGDGSFAPAPGSPIPLAANPHLLAVADVDRDGHLDVLATGHDHPGVFVWLGDGHGGFTAAPGSPYLAHGAEIRAHNHGLSVGDVSGDGVPDVITANDGNGSISVLVGDGTGRFSPAPGSPIPVGAEPYACALAGLDGDAFPDAVVPLVGGGSVAVLRGNGKGGFTPAAGSPYATIARPYAVAIADLDGDGRQDILIAHDDTDRLTILAGGDGGRLTPSAGSPISLGHRVFRMATADVNRDGAIDVVAGAGDRVLLLLAQPGGNLARASRVELPTGQTWTVAIGDLDRDGKPDLVAPDATTDTLRLWMSSPR